MEKEKKNYLDEAMRRVEERLTSEQDREKILESIRKELVQSFKNGIEVGRKRVSNLKKVGEAVPAGGE